MAKNVTLIIPVKGTSPNKAKTIMKGLSVSSWAKAEQHLLSFSDVLVPVEPILFSIA